MKKNLLSLILIFCLAAFCLGGCASKESVNRKLTVSYKTWSEMGGSSYDPIVYSPVEKGTEIYNGYFSSVTVKSVTDGKIVLTVDGCLVEPNEDGTINMNKDPLKKVTLGVGESIELVSQTMDGGVNVFLSFE